MQLSTILFFLPSVLAIAPTETFKVNAVTTTLPASKGLVQSSTAIPVSGSFDGGMKRYDRNRMHPNPLPLTVKSVD